MISVLNITVFLWNDTNQWINLRKFKLFSPDIDRAEAQMSSAECQVERAQTLECSSFQSFALPFLKESRRLQPKLKIKSKRALSVTS